MTHSFCMPNKTIQGLYVITDPGYSAAETLISDVTLALKGGAKIVQFRDKSSAYELQLTLAKQLKTLCESYQAWLIINDNIQLAKHTQAHGVHIGQKDGDIKTARELLGAHAIIGVTCYNDYQRAERMQNLGADYVAFGRFFPSLTKPNAPQADIKTLIQAKQKLTIPIVAIGGINHTNAKQLIDAGVDSLAVIQAVFGQADIKSAAQSISQHFKAPSQ
ncbi:MAG: thiamine phosphate synthase [Pseudomonadota bacterium]